ILRWCLQVAGDSAVDDLDGEDDTLEGARSMFDGPAPRMSGFADSADESDGIAQVLHEWHSDEQDPIAWSDMAVVSQTQRRRDALAQSLADKGIPVKTLAGTSEENQLGDTVRLMTMHRAKGLEYRAMALAGLGAGQLVSA